MGYSVGNLVLVLSIFFRIFIKNKFEFDFGSV